MTKSRESLNCTAGQRRPGLRARRVAEAMPFESAVNPKSRDALAITTKAVKNNRWVLGLSPSTQHRL